MDKSEFVPVADSTAAENMGAADWAPYNKKEGPRTLSVGFGVYRDWERSGFGQVGDIEWGDVKIPSFMDAVALLDCDKADPLNQIRVFALRIGKRLGYKLTFADMAGKDPDLWRLALQAFFLIGVEHGAEIRDAIAEEKNA